MRNPSVRCIPIETVAEMNKALANGDIDINALYNMTSAERLTSFKRFASTELAKDINADFEGAMVSKHKDALKNFVERTFNSKKETPEYAKMVEKINKLDDAGALGDANADGFLTDLVADAMGISVSADEVNEIRRRAKELEDAFSVTTPDGIPSKEYWVKRKEMEDYLHSLAPSHVLKVSTSVSGRGAMLLSVKSPLTNIISNTVNGFLQGLERRISSGTYKGLNGGASLAYVKKVMDIYQASGFDISRLESMGAGQVRLGEEIVSAQGKGVQRAVGRWYEDIVFKQLMGTPDVAASAVAFADSVDLASTKLAKGDQAKALEIFNDAIKIEPQTLEGQIVRSQAIADARLSTYTNKGGYSDVAMAVRNVLNTINPDLRLGDQLMPFVRTPANVVQLGVDTAGVGIYKVARRLPEAIREARNSNKEPMLEVVRLAVRSGLGMTIAALIAFMFDPEDFIGEYDSMTQKGRDMAKAKNAPYNSIKIGDKYVSMDYFGPLAPTIVGIMYARKYGKGADGAFQYVRGVGTQAMKIPGLREFSQLVTDISTAVRKGDMMDAAGNLTDEGINYVRARVIPAIVSDFAKGTDEVERETGKDALAKTASSIPVLRQTLPEKINQLTGESVKGEGLVSTLLFGSRMKSERDSDVVDEISRLYELDSAPVISDIQRSSKRIEGLREQIGKDKFQDALKYYGKSYGKEMARTIKSYSYKKLTIDEKKKELDGVREQAIEETLERFRYKTPKKEKTILK